MLIMLMITLGWLELYQAGYMHRDISIGNVLRLRTPKEAPKFQVNTELMERVLMQDSARVAEPTTSMERLSLSQESPSGSQADHGAETMMPSSLPFMKQASLCQELIDGMTLPPYSGFISDGDLAAHWPTYFKRGGASREHSVSSIGCAMSLVSDQV